MRVSLQKDLCIGAGQCVLAAPAVFDQDEDGTVVPLADPPPAEEAEAVRSAAHACPARVISVG
ncbi:MAG: ferredoxin [Pseudonocardia sp.]|jgi:ferredoxin|uniref:ferredoxin n=1 Tax=Pseudonocardia sp. TaxID=60912 RepID=UPI00262178A2|nr:ferredoxin [Pseudonocardia sp.]MCU1629471.1 ferredoxin [Pseudonocardia sp.]MDT7699720.1 ferredoxin [Pseudonocardiales bacterium]HEV7468824.1 ferredoxin [Pseudonocardia sp.]